MNAKTGFYAILMIIVLIIGIWAYFFYLPYLNVISQEKEKIMKIKNQIQRSAKVGKDLDEIKIRLRHSLKSGYYDVDFTVSDITKISKVWLLK